MSSRPWSGEFRNLFNELLASGQLPCSSLKSKIINTFINVFIIFAEMKDQLANDSPTNARHDTGEFYLKVMIRRCTCDEVYAPCRQPTYSHAR